MNIAIEIGKTPEMVMGWDGNAQKFVIDNHLSENYLFPAVSLVLRSKIIPRQRFKYGLWH